MPDPDPNAVPTPEEATAYQVVLDAFEAAVARGDVAGARDIAYHEAEYEVAALDAITAAEAEDVVDASVANDPVLPDGSGLDDETALANVYLEEEARMAPYEERLQEDADRNYELDRLSAESYDDD